VSASQARNSTGKQIEGSPESQAAKKVAELQNRFKEAQSGANQVQDEITKVMDQRLNNR
jgi:hypothetical protein